MSTPLYDSLNAAKLLKKLSSDGLEWFQWLISSFTDTLFSKAAFLRASSMIGQNLKFNRLKIN